MDVHSRLHLPLCLILNNPCSEARYEEKEVLPVEIGSDQNGVPGGCPNRLH